MRKKIVAGYCRVASYIEKNDDSLEKQEKLLSRLAKKRGLVINRLYIDAGYSGANLKRPELKKLLADCKAGKVETVFVTDLDRIARYADLVLQVLRKLKKYKVRVLANEGYGLID